MDWIKRQIERIKRRKIHTFSTNKSRIETHSAMSGLFNRRSTAGRLWLCNDYKISNRLLFEWCMFPSFTQEHCMCRPKKKILKLKISNLSSMIISRSTTVLHKKQMIFSFCWNKLLIFTPFNFTSNFRDASDHIAGYAAFKACQILQTAAPWSYASAHTHGDSYVNLLSRDGLKHPSKQLSDCVARIFTILEASSAAILKSTLPSKKAGKITLTSYLACENLFWKRTNVWLEKWLASLRTFIIIIMEKEKQILFGRIE